MRLRLRRRHLTVAALGLGTALAVAACLPADGAQQQIALAGSDTTQDVMAAIASAENGNTSWNSDPDTLQNILSQQFTAKTVPADSDCAARTYHTPPGGGEVAAPNGSGQGRDALRTSVQNGDGCIDVARSSSPPRAIGQDLASFEYYAFALDAVGWSSASANAPANLTLAQLRGIYNCTFTNWNQVGGTNQVIRRYWPQAGSGTRAFFQSDVLGFDPTTFSSGSCPAVTLTQENSGEQIATDGQQAAAIVPYSSANWIAQARGTQTDQRAGQIVRSLNGQHTIKLVNWVPVPNTSPGPVAESNVAINNPTPAYPGIRYVFNVVDNTHVRYNQALRYVGMANQSGGGKSPLCNAKRAATLESFGFGPLDTTVSARNLSGSTCRLYTP